MPGRDPERQYLIARESDFWLDEAREIDRRLDGMKPDDPERAKEQAWLEHIRAKRNELDEELLELQGVIKDAEILQMDDHRKDREGRA